MGQILHGSAKTTHAVRAAIQRSKATIAKLAETYDLNPKTVMKWRRRQSVEDMPMGPQDARSTVLSVDEEALCVAFRQHTLLPLDDCLYAPAAHHPASDPVVTAPLPAAARHLPVARHRGRQAQAKKRFKAYPIGYFHIDIAEVRTEEGKLHLFVAIDRTSQVRLRRAARDGNAQDGAAGFLRAPDRGRAVQDPHRADRQRRPVHDARRRRSAARHRAAIEPTSVWPHASTASAPRTGSSTG